MTEQDGMIPHRAKAVGVQNRESFGEELTALLAERTQRFTMRDSSSVRVETAESLVRGILYCVDLHLRTSADGTEGDAPLKTLYEAGVSDAERLARRGKLLLRQAEASRPPVVNIALNDTLSALPVFFRRYDADFFAHEIPCDIDYPLCIPVSEGLLGAEYVNEYLRRLIVENAFLRRFPPALLERVYTLQYGDYHGLLVNLYAAVAESSVGRALAGKRPDNLLTDSADRKLIAHQFSGMSAAQADEALRDAAASVCDGLGVSGGREREYLKITALALAPRIRSAGSPDGLKGVFAPNDALPEVTEMATEFIDGLRMADPDLRRLIAELQDCRYVSDQAAEIRRSVCSMRDLVEVLDAVPSEGLYEAAAEGLSEREKAALEKIAAGRIESGDEKGGWERKAAGLPETHRCDEP